MYLNSQIRAEGIGLADLLGQPVLLVPGAADAYRYAVALQLSLEPQSHLEIGLALLDAGSHCAGIRATVAHTDKYSCHKIASLLVNFSCDFLVLLRGDDTLCRRQFSQTYQTALLNKVVGCSETDKIWFLSFTKVSGGNTTQGNKQA